LRQHAPGTLAQYRQQRIIGNAHSWPRQPDNAILLHGVSFLVTLNITEDTPPPASATKSSHSSYPDLKGTWTGPGQSVTQGKTDYWPDAGAARPEFRKGSWTLVIDQQEGNLLTGSHGLTEGTRHDRVLGVIRADQKTIHMVDDDGTFLTILTGPDTLEMCRTEVTASSMLVGCRQLTRQR